MANTGTVIANDLRADRINAVVSNLHRLGVRNTVVVNYDGRAFPKVMGGFDRVLLDAPCSGLGVISRDQAVKMTRTVKDIMRTAHLQKELLRAAVDSVDARHGKPAIVVYVLLRRSSFVVFTVCTTHNVLLVVELCVCVWCVCVCVKELGAPPHPR
jgi:ribosomal RNA methyltransferase Nop2